MLHDNTTLANQTITFISQLSQKSSKKPLLSREMMCANALAALLSATTFHVATTAVVPPPSMHHYNPATSHLRNSIKLHANASSICGISGHVATITSGAALFPHQDTVCERHFPCQTWAQWWHCQGMQSSYSNWHPNELNDNPQRVVEKNIVLWNDNPVVTSTTMGSPPPSKLTLWRSSSLAAVTLAYLIQPLTTSLLRGA